MCVACRNSLHLETSANSVPAARGTRENASVSPAPWAVAMVLALTMLTGVTQAAATAEPATSNLVFEQNFGTGFLDQYWRLHPDDAISVGYYSVAAELWIPDQAGRDARLALLTGALARLHAIDPDALDAAHRSDHDVLENQLAGERWYLTELRDWEWNPALYNVAEGFAVLLDSDHAPLEQRLRTVLTRLAKVPAYYQAALANLHEPTREHTRLAIEQNQGALQVLGTGLEEKISSASLSDAERQQFAQRLSAARAAIQGYIDALTSLERDPTARWRSFRLGEALYERKFAFDIASGTSAKALYQDAQREKEALLTKMSVLTDELWPKVFPDTAPPAEPNARVGALIARLSEQHVAPDAFFQEIEHRVPDIERWIVEHDLLTLDPTKPLKVRITPAHKQGFAAASIDAPGPYDAAAPTWFNVTPPNARSPARAESFLREYNRWILPVLVIHEAVPGHYVQLLYANNSPSLIKALFGNGAMVEGWAVYSERMMMESGYGEDTAEQWLMYYKFNLRTVCNTLLDYGVQVLGMTEEDAHRLLVQEAFQSEEQAREKWHRATVSSVQLTSYFAGYSAIYAFREQQKRMLGPRFNLKRFHERFLSYGSAPVGVIESLMRAAEAP